MPTNLETQQWPQHWKRSVFLPVPKKDHGKNRSNYRTITFISHASNVVLKILQSRIQLYMNCELPDVQAGFRKGRGTEIKLPISIGSSKKRESSRKKRKNKKTYFCFIDYTYAKTLTVRITINCGKF